MSPKNFRTISAKSGKTSDFRYLTDGAPVPVHILVQPITFSLYGLKFFRPNFFGFEISRTKKISARNLKNRKIFGVKVEKCKKIRREIWKKRCQLAN